LGMRWTKSAEEAIAKVPFFVRKRVRKKIEAEAEAAAATEVTLDHVHAAKQHFLKKWKKMCRAIVSSIASVQAVVPIESSTKTTFLKG
jgi:hypothetical protein